MTIKGFLILIIVFVSLSSCQSVINLKEQPPFKNPCLSFDELEINRGIIDSVFKDTAHHRSYIKQLMTYIEDTTLCKICYQELYVPMEQLDYEPCRWTTKRFAALQLIEALFQRKQQFFFHFHYLYHHGRNYKDFFCLKNIVHINCECCWFEHPDEGRVPFFTTRKKHCHIRDTEIITRTFELYEKWHQVIEKKGLNQSRKERLDIKSFTNGQVYWKMKKEGNE